MTIHSSLKTSTSGGGQRNVWTRIERLAALKKSGKWQDGQREYLEAAAACGAFVCVALGAVAAWEAFEVWRAG